MASNSPFNTGRNYGPNIGYRGVNSQGAQGYPRPYPPQRERQQQEPDDRQEVALNDPEMQRAINVARAKKNGTFDLARQRYIKAAAREGKTMDEDGNIVGIDSAPTKTLYTKTPTGRYKPAAKVPLTEADQPHEPTQEELDAQRQSAIKDKYAKGQSVSDDARLEAGLPDTPRMSSADLAAAKARKEQADIIAAQEAEQAEAREAALTTAKEKNAAKHNSDRAYVISLNTKLRVLAEELRPIEAAEKAAQTNLALPKPDPAKATELRARKAELLKQVAEASDVAYESAQAVQKHLVEAATEKGKIDVFKAGIKLRHAKAMKVGDITVNTPEATRGTSGASTEVKPDPQASTIFGNAINNPFDKNSTGNLLGVNDPVRIKASKVLQQRMQMAMAEEDPNVRHYATKDVEARIADPVAWEAAQYDTMQGSSDEDLAGKLQVMPQVIEQGQALLQQAQLEAQAEQANYQRKLEQIVANNARDKDKPFTFADTKVNPTTGIRWHNAHLANYEATVAQANAAQAKAMSSLKTDENELNRDIAIHNKRMEEAKRRDAAAKEAQIKRREAGFRELELSGNADLATDLRAIDDERRSRINKITQTNPYIQEGTPIHMAAVEAVDKDIQAKTVEAYGKKASQAEAGKKLYDEFGHQYQVDWSDPEASDGVTSMMLVAAEKHGLNEKQARHWLSTYAQADWTKPSAVGKGSSPLIHTAGEDAAQEYRVLPNGNITVNPGNLLDKAEYERIVKSAPVSKTAKEYALKVRQEIAPELASRSIKTLRTNDKMAEWLDENTSGTDLERMEQFTAKMKAGGWTTAAMHRFASSLASIGASWTGAAAAVTGSDTFTQASIPSLLSSSWWKNRAEQFSTAAGTAEKGTGLLGKYAAMAVGGIPSVAESMVAGNVAGGIYKAFRGVAAGARALQVAGVTGAALDAAIQQGGSTYVDAYDKYLGDETGKLAFDYEGKPIPKAEIAAAKDRARMMALKPAFLDALQTAALTALGGAKGTQAIFRAGSKEALQGAVKKTMAKKLGELGLDIGEEAFEEYSNQFVSGVIAQATYEPDKTIKQIFEQAFDAGIVGGVLGGAVGALKQFSERDSDAAGDPSTTAASPTGGIKPEDMAAINAAIKGYTGGADATPEESAHTRNLAGAIVKLRGGAALSGLTQTELAAVGYERKADKIVPIKDAPQAAYEQDGKVVITQDAIDHINDAIPATNILGLKTEEDRLDEINNPPSEMTEQDKQQAEGTLPKPTPEQLAKPEVEVGPAGKAAPKTGSEEWLQAMPESELDTKIASAANVVNKAATMATQDGGDEGFRNLAELAQKNLDRLRGEKARRQAAPPASSEAPKPTRRQQIQARLAEIEKQYGPRESVTVGANGNPDQVKPYRATTTEEDALLKEIEGINAAESKPASSDPHAQLKANGGDVVHVADHAAAEKLAGRPVQKGRRAFTQRINGKPTVVVIDSEVASQKQRGGEEEMMAEEIAHAQTMLDEDANPALADEADAAMADNHPDFDANLDAFMRSNYNGYHKLSNRQKRYEAVAKIVSGEYKGQVQSKGIVALLKDMLAKLLKRDPGGKNAAVQKIASNVRAALGGTAEASQANAPRSYDQYGKTSHNSSNGRTTVVTKSPRLRTALVAELKAAGVAANVHEHNGASGKSWVVDFPTQLNTNARPTQQPDAVPAKPSDATAPGDSNAGKLPSSGNPAANDGEGMVGADKQRGVTQVAPSAALPAITAQLDAYIAKIKDPRVRAEAIRLRNRIIQAWSPYLKEGPWSNVSVFTADPTTDDVSMLGIGASVDIKDRTRLHIYPQLLLHYALDEALHGKKSKADDQVDLAPRHEAFHTLDPNSDEETRSLWSKVGEDTQRAFANSYYQALPDKDRAKAAEAWVSNPAMHAYAGREYFRAQMEKALLGTISEEVVANASLAKQLYKMIQALAAAINDFASTLKDKRLAGAMKNDINLAAARLFALLPKEVQADIRAKASKEGRTLPEAQSRPAEKKATRPELGKAPPQQRIAMGKGAAGGPAYAEFATPEDADAYRWYSAWRDIVSPGKTGPGPNAKAAIASTLLARVAEATGLDPADLRNILTDYNKAVREQAKGVAEGEAFHAPRLEDFMRGGETQQMAAPAAMEARKQIQSDFDEAKREAEEDGSDFDEQRFIYDLREGDLEEAFPDIYSDYFGNPETTNRIVYHHTPDENTESIIENGVGAMSKTRGLNNRGVRAAVFTSAEPDPMNSYGNTVVAIDLAAARKLSGVSTSLEPAIAESIRRAAVSNMLGIEASDGDFQSSDSSGETPDTLIIHGSVPKQAIQVSNKDGEVLFTGSAFGKAQAMAAPKGIEPLPSPKEQIAAVRKQHEGKPTWRKAPNGKDSNLTEEQWVIVRTPNFKRWFGDWEAFASQRGGVWNDDANKVSKVVDDNGEPRVVYHGSQKAGFNTFDMNETAHGHRPPSAWFSSQRDVARTYSGTRELATINQDEEGYDRHRGNYAVFLNIRNPHEEYFEGANWDGRRPEDEYSVWDSEEQEYVDESDTKKMTKKEAQALYESLGGDSAQYKGRTRYDVQNRPDYYISTNDAAYAAKDNGNDGTIIHDVVDDGAQHTTYDTSDVYVAFDPNQIKDANSNSGAFSSKDNNILFMAAPSYRSPTDMLAATKAQMQGGAGAKPAGLASMFNPQAKRPATGERKLFEMPKQSVENIHAAYDSAVVGKSSAYITLDELYNALKAKETSITPQQFADMLRKMDENGQASLEISEDSATTARNLAKYGLRMGTVPASGVAIHPRFLMMPKPLTRKQAGDILKGATYIGPDQLHNAKISGPVVVGVAHGTTHEIERFSATRGNPGNDMGIGVYASNSIEDINENYAGIGPDLTNRIEQEAERLYNNGDGEDADGNPIDEDQAKAIAKERLAGHGGAVIPLYIPMENPVVLDDNGGTIIELYKPLEEYRADAEQEVRDENGLGEDDSLEDYKNEINDKMSEMQSSDYSADKAVQDISRVINRFESADGQAFASELTEDGEGEIRASKLEKLLRDSEHVMYATDDNGETAVGELVRQVFMDALGFDGIIDRNVNRKFGSRSRGIGMAGVDEDTVHVIVATDSKLRPRNGFDPSVQMMAAPKARKTAPNNAPVNYSMEMIPGANTGHAMVHLIDAPYAIKEQYHKDVTKAFLAPGTGIDLLAEAFGLNGGLNEGFTEKSAYMNSQGQIEFNPSTQVPLQAKGAKNSGQFDQSTPVDYSARPGDTVEKIVSMLNNAGTKAAEIEKSLRKLTPSLPKNSKAKIPTGTKLRLPSTVIDKVKAYALAHGILQYQEAVAGMRPVTDENVPLENRNAITIDIGRPLGSTELQALQGIILKRFGTVKDMGYFPTKSGFYLANFGISSNTEFQDLATDLEKDALFSGMLQDYGYFTTHEDHSFCIERGKPRAGSPADHGYVDALAATGYGPGFERVRLRIEPRLAEVNRLWKARTEIAQQHFSLGIDAAWDIALAETGGKTNPNRQPLKETIKVDIKPGMTPQEIRVNAYKAVDAGEKAEGREPASSRMAQVTARAKLALSKMSGSALSMIGISVNKNAPITFKTLTEFQSHLETILGDIVGKESVSDLTAAQKEQLVEALNDMVIGRLIKDGSGADWYNTAVQVAMAITHNIHPELRTDFDNERLYKALVAATSQGQKVDFNWHYADLVYRYWKDNSKLPDIISFGGKSNAQITGNLIKLQRLIDEHGLKKAMDIMDTPMTASEIDDMVHEMMPELKKKSAASGEQKSALLYAAMMLGPKIGSFYGNLNYRFDTVTMDLWFMRTMQRLLGRPFGISLGGPSSGGVFSGKKVTFGGLRGQLQRLQFDLESKRDNADKAVGIAELKNAVKVAEKEFNKATANVRNATDPDKKKQAKKKKEAGKIQRVAKDQLYAARIKLAESTFGPTEKAVLKEIQSFLKLNDSQVTDKRNDVITRLTNVAAYSEKVHGEYQRHGYRKQFASEHTRSAKSVDESLTSGKEAPGSGGERNDIREIMEALQIRLLSQGLDLAHADVQAVLWYAEKDLYSAFGVAEDAEGQDYGYSAAVLASKIANGEDIKRGGSVGDSSNPADVERVKNAAEEAGEDLDEDNDESDEPEAQQMAAPSQQQQANIDAATYDFARPAPPSDPGHIRNARYIPKRGLQSNPQLPLTSAFYATNSLRAKMGQTIRSFENDWAGFFDFINDQLPAEKRKAGLRKIVNKFAMGDKPEAKALWKAYAAMPMDQVLPADSERVKEAKELLPFLEQIEVMHMGTPKSQVTPEQDAEYMAAVESGDVAKQQAMVDAAAKAAGYTIGPVWHGSKGKPATFDKAFAEREDNWSFSNDPAVAESYQNIDVDAAKVWKAYEDSSGVEREKLNKLFAKFQNEDGEVDRSSAEAYAEAANMDQPKLWVGSLHAATGRPRNYFHSANSPGSMVKAFLKIKNPLHRYFDGTPNVQKQTNPQGEADGYIDHDVSDTETGTYRKVSTVYHANEANQIKSADPITRDAEGNVIPLSQRFNDQSNDILYMAAPKDQSGLDSRVLKRLANAIPEDDYLDQLDTAYSESFPDGSEGDWLRALQKENITPDTVKAWDRSARRMIAKDPRAVVNEIVNNFYEGKSFGSPELALAGSILSADLLKQAQLSGDDGILRKARAFCYAVGAGETQVGRELRALNNPHKSNRERVAEVIANLFTTPPPAVRAKIANAPSPSAKLKKIAELQKRIKELEAQIVAGNKVAQKQAEVVKKELADALRVQDKAQLVDEALAKREKKVKEALANEGLTVEDVFLTPEDRLAAQDSEIVQRARAKHTAAQQKALLWIGRGFSDTDVAKFSGMERGAVATLREDYRNNSLKPEIAKEIKSGRSILEVIKDSFKKAFGIQMAAPLPWGNVQRVQPTPPKPPKNKTVQPPKVEDTVADEIDRMLDILAPNARLANGNSLLAAVVKGKNGTRVTIQVPFDADDFKSVYRVARAISISEASGFDKMYEYWINNLLSGPQTNWVNIIGNTLSVGIQYLAQRPLETAVNLFTRDEKSAQLGEWEYIAKGVATGLGEAWQNAVLAFSVEADPTAHRYLNEPMHIGFTPSGDVAKMGGYRGPSVKGLRGRVIRIPGRLLRMMDAMFKTFILHAEVGAMAYRLGKIEQRAGRIGATGADLQAFIQDQIATKGSKSWMQAMRTATDLTFQDENWLTDIAKNFTQGADKRVDKRRADAAKAYAEGDTELGHSMELRANAMYFTAKLMSIIFPFVRTPSNILRMGVRKSPLGSLLLPLHFIQMIRQGITNKIKGKDFLDSYPKGVLVKLLAEQTLAWMVTMGLMSAIEGDDDDDKKRFIIVGGRPWKDSGATDAARRDYGGTYLLIWRNAKGEETRIPFGRYEPVATLLGTTADAVRRFKERARRERNGEPGANMEDAAKALLGDFVNQAGDKSFLQGIAGVMKEIESLEDSGNLSKGIKETAWKSILTAIVPNIIRQPMRNIDDKMRDSKKKNDWYDAFPMGDNAEPVIDLFGRDVEKGGDPFTRILFPVANKQLPTHPITPLIHQWNSKNTADKIEPTPMNRSGFYIYNTDGKTKIPLVTPQEKAALQRVIGSNLRTSAATVAENIKANGGDIPENFDKVVDKIITAARTDARKTAIQSSPFLAAKQKQP